MTNRQIQRALRYLKEFCYSHERCDSCEFSDFREDMGFICYVNKIVDDDRFFQAVKSAPDPTVTISSGTFQAQPMRWEEFDDDL